MKTLYVLRHAKSSWKDLKLSDFERPLNKRGKKAAPVMGKLMLEKGLLPELIISSPAERAKQTANLIKDSAKIHSEIKFDERIYEASTNTLVHILSEVNANISSVMIVGHNPGFEGIVGILTGEYERMPTAALAVIQLNIDSWQEVTQDCGNLITVFRPKEYRSMSSRDFQQKENLPNS